MPVLVVKSGLKKVRHQLPQREDFVIGRDRMCDLILEGSGVSRRHAQLKVDAGHYVLHDLGSTNGTFVNGERVDSRELAHGDEVTICRFSIVFDAGSGLERSTEVTGLGRKKGDTTLLEEQFRKVIDDLEDRRVEEDLKKYHQLVRKSRSKLSTLANRDRLTKLYNRRLFDARLSEEVERARRHRRRLSLILIDIDHFKKCNDEYGHQKGDEVLAGISELISSKARVMDTVARYGGEEIAVILPETEGKDAAFLAGRFRQLVAEESRSLLGVKITVSIGVGTFPDQADDEASLIGAADRALYQAKKQGRNRVVGFKG